ncbi:hypothetical protein H9P43_002270 [Blastocladiella emersonii ATCC 22665]|nr:hypothetical protein H9P43_002270 [Blastocladiella emersonii ATCC 22665]
MPKWDWDDIFAYDTFKVVRVRDRRLGLVYYSCSIAIAVYILYSIISQQLYLQREPVTGGSVRITIQPPPGVPGTPDYCSKAPNGCVYYDGMQVTPSNDLNGVIFVTTRVTVSNTTTASPNCGYGALNPPSVDCIPQIDRASSRTYYAANIEDYTLMVEHTARGKSTSRSARNGDLLGSLKSKTGSPIAVYVPTQSNAETTKLATAMVDGAANRIVARSPSVAGDVMTIRQLLDAADLSSLDVKSTAPGAGANETVRESGIVILVMVTYTNRRDDSSALTYSYDVSNVSGAEAKFLESVPITNAAGSTTIQIRNRHGLRIVFTQTGMLGEFQLMALLTNLVASLAMLRVAIFGVEFLMVWVLPQRKAYRAYKVQVTADFSELRERSPERGRQPGAALADNGKNDSIVLPVINHDEQPKLESV